MFDAGGVGLVLYDNQIWLLGLIWRFDVLGLAIGLGTPWPLFLPVLGSIEVLRLWHFRAQNLASQGPAIGMLKGSCIVFSRYVGNYNLGSHSIV
jgi:hypothetical protein